MEDYQKQTDLLVTKALKVASTYSSVVERLADVLADLDVYASLARVVLTAPCSFVRPELDASGGTGEGAERLRLDDVHASISRI